MMPLTWSFFPKLFAELSPVELAGLVREVGLDTVNLVVRDGFWVRRESLRADLPPFMTAMQEAGLNLKFATTGFSAADVAADPDLIAILGDHGLTEFRLDHFHLDRLRAVGRDVRGALAQARAEMEAVVPACERAGVRAVYQVHHNTLIASASAAWTLVSGLPPRWVGVELDPGNQSFEGYEAWDRSAGLLGEYLAAIAVKDTALTRDPARAGAADKGWRREWSPIDEGVVNWQELVQALTQTNFSGTLVFMPFYDTLEPNQIKSTLRREVAYLRRLVAEVNSPR